MVVAIQGRGAGDMASWQQSFIVLVALVLTLLPKEIPGALDDEADDQLLGALHIPHVVWNLSACQPACSISGLLARSPSFPWSAGELAAEPEVAKRLDSTVVPGEGFMAVARMAWGLLLAQHGPATARGAPL